MGLEALQNVGSSAAGIEPESLALAGEFLTTGPPGSPEGYFFILGLLSVQFGLLCGLEKGFFLLDQYSD